MNYAPQIAKHLKEVFFGGNWTASCLQQQLAGLSWQQATAQIGALNTILALTYHIGYYVRAVKAVLEQKPLEARDKYSFNHPPVQSQPEWEALMQQTFTEAEQLIALVANLPEETLATTFVVDKYGNYYRNLHGLIEHTHYHLGQIALIKKMLTSTSTQL